MIKKKKKPLGDKFTITHKLKQINNLGYNYHFY